MAPPPHNMMDKPHAVIAIGFKGDDKEMDDMPKGVDVPEPKGWTWPDGMDPKEGDKFMCTVKQGPEGMLTIVDIDGMPVGDMPEPPDEDDKPEPDEKGDGAIGLLGRLLGKERKP